MGATLDDLEAQLRDLQGKLEQTRQALSAGGAPTGDPGSGDSGGGGAAGSFTPDIGQHIGVDGSLTYDFTGHIHAQGLDLDAGGGAGNNPNVRWLRTSDGALVAQIDASSVGHVSTIEMVADDTSGSVGSAALTAIYDENVPLASVLASAAYVGPPSTPLITNRVAKIIDGAGVSDFLQLAARAQRSINFGVNQVTFAASTLSAPTAINHGLTSAPGIGKTPIAVLATSIGGALITYDTRAYNATQFTAQGLFGTATTGTFSFVWIAIG
jgi:hypothetical protein